MSVHFGLYFGRLPRPIFPSPRLLCAARCALLEIVFVVWRLMMRSARCRARMNVFKVPNPDNPEWSFNKKSRDYFVWMTSENDNIVTVKHDIKAT